MWGTGTAAPSKIPPYVRIVAQRVTLPVTKTLCYYISKLVVRSDPVLLPNPQESNALDDMAAHFYESARTNGATGKNDRK